MRDAEEVISIFINLTGIEREHLFGNCKSYHVRYARHILYHVLREKCGLSSYALAKLFNRSRRNIVRGLSSVRDSMKIYKDVKLEVENIMKEMEDA